MGQFLQRDVAGEPQWSHVGGVAPEKSILFGGTSTHRLRYPAGLFVNACQKLRMCSGRASMIEWSSFQMLAYVTTNGEVDRMSGKIGFALVPQNGTETVCGLFAIIQLDCRCDHDNQHMLVSLSSTRPGQ